MSEKKKNKLLVKQIKIITHGYEIVILQGKRKTHQTLKQNKTNNNSNNMY